MLNKRICMLTLGCLLVAAFVPITLQAGSEDTELTVYVGQSDVITFDQPVKRVAIASPIIADATVISANQILIVGNSAGTTTMIVWSDQGAHTKYKLKIQDEPSAYQVMLQVRFLEINKTALKELGSDLLIKNMKVGSERLDIGSYGGKVNFPSDPLLIGSAVDLFFSIPSQGIAGIIKALHENNMVKVLATPNITTISGTEATLLAGGEFPIPIVSGSMGMQTVTIQYKEFGVKLKFTPTILDSSFIRINVNAEVSSMDFENGITLSGFQIPALISRKAQTVIELKEGEFLVIGGLLSNEITETVSKIPILGHIPILGKLFSSKRFQNKKTELLITLSPHIIHPVTEDELPKVKLGVEKKKKAKEGEQNETTDTQ